ncbi:hypothetical protein [Microbacterium lushaniae]|uniref:Uncharacterized protein n=1 Tax=Microbacterium lushaniae TaxID=2614639 RepID=A0A5J6L8K3_9MICO|nr:hypothetical protein [Microbacterium lushaniae]QEW04642.1 hypothetical protein F6J85_17155 [Microbacterium lushaniae]
MATNILRNRVINPDSVDVYRQVDFAHGSVFLLSGAVLAAQAVVFSRFYPADSKRAVIILVLGALALLVGVVFGVVLAVKNRRRKLSLSRPLKPLRAVVAFDKKSVSNETVWDAAALAETDPDLARALIEKDAAEYEPADAAQDSASGQPREFFALGASADGSASADG